MAVDFCPPTVVSQVPAYPLAGAEFSCAACAESFAGAAEQRAHAKSERHVYNTKRRLNGLKPIPQEAWERKLRESRGNTGGLAKGTAHLKVKKAQRKGSDETTATSDATVEQTSQPPDRLDEAADAINSNTDAAADAPEADGTSKGDEKQWTPECCLFDQRRFGSIEECMKYSWWHYNFSVPDKEYCTDIPGLLTFLHEKITRRPYACLFCNRQFADAASVRRHMLDKNHTRVGTEARTRRGRVDAAGSRQFEDELEDFYDFHGSTREITERITDPIQQAASLFRFADSDRDGFLRRGELAALWELGTGGDTLSEAQYLGACSLAGVDPDAGLNIDDLQQLYDGGLADLEIHFKALQDRLTQRLVLKAGRGARGKQGTASDMDAIEEGNEDEETNEGDEAPDEDDEEGEDEDDDGDSSGTEVYECDDEDEFEEVMRVLGLEKATLLDNGDLRLPSGGVAVHRDVAHIWKQRGQRFQEVALPGGPSKVSRRTALMLTNGPMIAMTRRQENREHKKIVAVLRRQQHEFMQLGVKQNILQKKKGNKIRTVFGDASGGR